MSELWRRASELIAKRPGLWVPVLVAELFSYLVMLGRGALIHHILLSHLRAFSVLGNAPVPTRLTGASAVHVNNLAIAVTGVAYFLRLLFYAAALVATAALAEGYLAAPRKAVAGIVPALRSRVLGMISLALRALAIYAAVALLSGWITHRIAQHGPRASSLAIALDLATGLVLDVLLAWLLAPAAVQALTGELPGPPLRQRAQLFAFSLAVVALALNVFVSVNLRAVHVSSVAARVLLELTGSWIAALPYALLFVGLALLALEQRTRSRTPAHSAEAP